MARKRSNLKLVPFLTEEVARSVQREFGTPIYVYDQRTLERQANLVLNFPNAFGLTARYAMKACSTGAVLKVLTDAGLHIDASSGYEVERALRVGVPPNHIQLTAQELPDNLKALIEHGVLFNACSIAQLHAFGALFPGRELSIRVNPGLGSGHNNRTNVGGPSASFGIWHEYLPEALAAGRKYGLRFTRLHTHIGSGSDPKPWQRVALMSLDICSRVPDVAVLNLGGGYKVGRMPGEPTINLRQIGLPIVQAFRAFARKYGRKLHLEIEPGTYLVAHAAALITTVIDVMDTGRAGYKFLKVNAGMTDLLRPSLYGAQHPIEIVPARPATRPQTKYVVVGHCCESGDLFTPAPANPEILQPRLMSEARIGDLLVFGGVGAYCASMSAKNYNSFPEPAEVMLATRGSVELIRKRQRLDQITRNEVIPSFLKAPGTCRYISP